MEQEQLLNERRRREFSKSYSAAPFIVYRSEKYSGLWSRVLKYVASARAYLFAHTLIQRCISKGSSLVYDVVNVILLVLCLPVLIASFCAIQTYRKIQLFLVRKYFPESIICYDFSPRSFTSTEEETDVITSVIWVKGQLDINLIKSGIDTKIKSCPSSLSLLRKVLNSHLRTLVWEDASNFNISNHITNTSSKFCNALITDDPLTDLSGYSVLQKYVSHCASTPLDTGLPPWRIVVIPLPYTSSRNSNPDKSTSVLILRFHRLLLNEKSVIQMFLSSLGQKNALDLEVGEKECNFLASAWSNDITKLDSSLSDSSSAEICDKSVALDCHNWKDKSFMVLESMSQKFDSFLLDFGNWITLRLRQSEFHSRLAVGKLIVCEVSESVVRNVQHSIRIETLRDFISRITLMLRAILFLPSILFKIIFTQRSLSHYGFRNHELSTIRRVSWSKQISVEFLNEICKKTENSSPEPIFLAAISIALRDYYRENAIKNPKTVGAGVFSTISHSFSQKLVSLPTRFVDIPREINNLEEELFTFTVWKQQALNYLVRLTSSIIPRWMAYLVIKKMCNYYPIQLNVVDTQAQFPHMTFWGHNVEEFTFWRPLESNSCISITIIKYAGTFRLSVYSPMKSVDALISHRFAQYLNQIAEAVHVERSRIPYSKKSSPLSSPTVADVLSANR